MYAHVWTHSVSLYFGVFMCIFVYARVHVGRFGVFAYIIVRHRDNVGIDYFVVVFCLGYKMAIKRSNVETI